MSRLVFHGNDNLKLISLSLISEGQNGTPFMVGLAAFGAPRNAIGGKARATSPRDIQREPTAGV